MRTLITTGHVYVAVPPLYRIYKQDAKGKINEVYAWDDKGLEEGKAKIGAGYKVSRYKGLGEMSDKQLKETTMDPKNRMLVQIHIDDPLIVENKVSTLMGKDADKRKKWLEQNVDFNEIDKFMEEVRH
jgi:topoisomerase-4 subunit B